MGIRACVREGVGDTNLILHSGVEAKQPPPPGSSSASHSG